MTRLGRWFQEGSTLGGRIGSRKFGAPAAAAPMEDPVLAALRVRLIVGGAPLFLLLFVGLVVASPTPVRALPAVVIAGGIVTVALGVWLQHLARGPFPRNSGFAYVVAALVVASGPLISALGPGPATAISVSQSFIVMAVVVITLEGRTQIVAGVGHAVAWLLTGWVLNDPTSRDLITGAIFQTGAVGVMVLAGQLFSSHVLAAASANESARRARAEAELARVQERRRLAESLHDHALRYVMRAFEKLQDAPRDATSVLGAEAQLSSALRALRGLTLNMRDDLLAEIEPRVALEYAVAEAAHDDQLSITLDAGPGLDWRHTVLLVESTRELLANVRNHAQAHTVVVRAQVTDGRLRLVVEDDGIGVIDAEVLAAFEDGRTGVWRLRRHAEVLGGTFSFHPRPGGGTRAVLDVEDRPRGGDAPSGPR